MDDLEYVLGVSVQLAVARRIVGPEIGVARPDVIEQDDLVVVLEIRGDEAPHVLVASKTVSKKQRLGALAGHLHVVSSKYIYCHCGATPGDRRDLRGSTPVAFYANAKLRFWPRRPFYRDNSRIAANCCVRSARLSRKT